MRRLITIAKHALAISVIAAMSLATIAVLPHTALAEKPSDKAEASSTNKDVIAIAFQQNWKSVASECTNVYGPEGVGYVEVSPPQESIQGTAWWTSYQPVSYSLNSKLGNEDEFKTMIEVCQTAGVGVIADAVLNHTTGVDKGDGIGTGGSAYDANGNFPGVPYTIDDFHDCKKTSLTIPMQVKFRNVV